MLILLLYTWATSTYIRNTVCSYTSLGIRKPYKADSIQVQLQLQLQLQLFSLIASYRF